nr:MAG TPA: hypothetical protein [Caudoviricetes sp.]
MVKIAIFFSNFFLIKNRFYFRQYCINRLKCLFLPDFCNFLLKFVIFVR